MKGTLQRLLIGPCISFATPLPLMMKYTLAYHWIISQKHIFIMLQICAMTNFSLSQSTSFWVRAPTRKPVSLPNQAYPNNNESLPVCLMLGLQMASIAKPDIIQDALRVESMACLLAAVSTERKCRFKVTWPHSPQSSHWLLWDH